MATANGTTTEQTSLLSGGAHSGSRSATTQARSSKKLAWLSPVTVITIITLVYRLATTLLITTTIRILHIVACQLWFHIHDPDAFPDGRIPEEFCATAEVDQYYAGMVSITTIVDGLGGIFGTGATSYLSSRIGRKPVLIFLLFCSMIEQLAILTVQHVYRWKQFAIFGLIAIVETIGNENTTVFLVSMYIVDITEAEQRTAALSAITGWLVLGGAISYSIGGFITTYSHSDSAVYMVAFVIVGLVVTFTVLMLPESFPAENRELLRLERLAEAPVVSHTLAQRFKAIVAVALEPLELLKPTYNPLTRKANWRLVYCTAHTFIVTVADAYALPAMLIFFTTQYSYTPAQMGYVMTTYSFISVFVLAIALPLLIRWFKSLYKRTQEKSIHEEEEEHHGADLADGIEATRKAVVSETSDHMDVHITIISWAIESLAYIVFGTMGTFIAQLLAVASMGLGSGRIPGTRSLVAASVDPLKQGEALASVEMVSNVGRILSPIIMGTIMINSMIFYVHAVIVAVGAAILFLVRDSDRYQKPAVVLESEELQSSS